MTSAGPAGCGGPCRPGEDTFTTWAETTTVYHEGVPGHHLQVATATYRRELLNKWRRNVCWTSGHGEGWALYAEKLMQELGYLTDPGDHMGMLDMQRMRAARVVFDIGVHLELEVPERWGSGHLDPGQGLRVPASRTLRSARASSTSSSPATSAGRARRRPTRWASGSGSRSGPSSKPGRGFDLKAFHTKALNIGSVGLDTLRRALLGEDPLPAA